MNSPRKLLALQLEDRLTPSTLLSGFNEQVIATGLNNPTTMSIADDGRIFVALQNGEVRIIQGGAVLPTPLLDIDTPGGGEGGLVGFALDPDFINNSFFYAYYLVPSVNGSAEFNRVSRFTADGNSVVPNSEVILLNLDPIVAPAGSYTHNGGAMHFGLDGKLYIATGDNVDPQSSQDLNSFRGKILRINPDGTIPADNPTSFQGVSGTTSGTHRAIYAIGFRNPFTFDVHPGNGRIFINDVGQDSFEEINELQKGRNYGWPQTEGYTTNPNVTGPIFSYAHGFTDDTGLAVTGGTFYSPQQFAFPGNLHGDYFFADFVGNYIKSYDLSTGQVTMFARNLTRGGVVDLDVSPTGDLYYLARGTDGSDSGVYRIRHTNEPGISQQPGGRRLTLGERVTLSVQANGPGLRYQWTRNGFDIAGANGPTFTVTGLASENQVAYRVVVQNNFGTVVSNAAVITVTDSSPPTATILTPNASERFIAGQTITATGSGFDQETGVVPGSALSWTVEYYTGNAVRPLVTDAIGSSITFTIPDYSPYTRADVFYRITLTAKDPSGYIGTAVRDLQPQTAIVTLGASAPTAVLTLDGQPVGASHVFTGVSGLNRTLTAPSEVTEDGVVWPFIGWFDGETTTTRTISTPVESMTFFAVYKRPSAGAPGVVIGAGAGGGPVVKLFNDQGQLQSERFAFSPAFRNGISVAMADFTGDGVADIAAATGPGEVPQVALFDGATGIMIRTSTVFETHFRGGVTVSAADFDGDGKAELIVTPGLGGGPRVRVLKANTGDTVLDFFGINDTRFRGGARAAAGDLNGDGKLDLVVAAGDGGGPRIAGWDGEALLRGEFVSAFRDYFAFAPSLRGGAFVTLGDIDGDGLDDIICGAGAGGGPNVVIRRSSDSSHPATFSGSGSFFVGDKNDRGGIRVLARDLDGDGIAEIITGTGGDVVPVVAVNDANGKQLRAWAPFGAALDGGVFVG